MSPDLCTTGPPEGFRGWHRSYASVLAIPCSIKGRLRGRMSITSEGTRDIATATSTFRCEALRGACDFRGWLHHFRRELLSRFGGVVVGRFSELKKAVLWDRFGAGESLRSISRRLGRAPSSVRTHIVAAGWKRPVPAADWCQNICGKF